ncbi:A/G-specific adenine glycosylase [Ruminococcus sp.]|uniref:A/G-specific adenine glycosylase n=1 Tax=Ruminococcus sp. TaxID=41978 RepID=UPI003F1143A8
MDSSQFLAQCVSRLLAWYPSHARDLPWRQDREPYHVWLSEIMLQQTRVEAVKGYYQRFLQALPDIDALARAPEEQLLKLWEGLGYYNRVRNLQKAAQQICTEYGGIFPDTYESIRKLSGIGPYTAGAIASICFEHPTPAVDGNVLRVMARLMDDHSCVDLPRVKQQFTDQLAAVYPVGKCGMLTQALMELGATVCVPKGTPDCAACPVSALCLARKRNTVGMLPVRAEKKQRRIEHRTVFVFLCGDTAAVRKRENRGLLAGLWEFPNLENLCTPEEAIAWAEQMGVQPAALLQSQERTHIFTHIEWHMTCYYLRCMRPSPEFVWADHTALEKQYSLPTAFRLFLPDVLALLDETADEPKPEPPESGTV